MKLDISIREKLVVYFVALGVCSTLIVVLYSYNTTKKAILSRSFEQLTSVREVKKSMLTHFFSDRKREIELISRAAETVTSLERSCLGQDFTRENLHIYSFLSMGEYYSSIVFADSSGRYYTTHWLRDKLKQTGSGAACHAYDSVFSVLKSEKKLILTDYVICDSTPTIFFASPVFNADSVFVGGVFLTVPLDAINRIMLEQDSRSGLGESGESYLVGSDKYMRSTSRFGQESVLTIKVESEGVAACADGRSDTQVITDYRGIPVLSSFTSLGIEGLGWHILAEIDLKEVMLPVLNIRNRIILLACAVCFGMLSIAVVVSNRIINPLISLRDMAIHISKGKYGATIPVTGQDEIADLTEAFNKMSIQIKEQTKELIEREKRLKHFYEATKDGIILHHRGIPVLINQAMASQTGYRIEELMLKNINEIIAVNDTDRYLSHPDKPFSYETIAYRKNGSKFPVEVQENPIEFEGKILSSSVIRDIQERKEAQEALNKEREKSMSSFIDGQEGERERLSRELHDGLGQALIAMKMQLESIKPDDIARTEKKVATVKSFVINTIEDVRRMSNNLMPAVLSNFGLVDALNHLIKQIAASTPIQINFDHRGENRNLPPKLSTYIYRIVQEAINNAVKHSAAREISVMLIIEETKIWLLIEDDGKGFSQETLRSAGNGLYNMRERVNLLHGTIDITPTVGKGVIINVKIPIKEIG
jgi:PAS domain S-box-containing protein